MLALLLTTLLATSLVALDMRECNRPLGMTSGTIRDDQITVSSSFDEISTGPKHSRLRLHTGSGAWCPLKQINRSTKEWIQVSFGSEMVISAIETEGRFDGGRGMEYPTAYRIEYWRSSLHGWAVYKMDTGNEVVPGNTDTQSGALRVLDGAIIARRLRIIPVSNTTRTVCLRFELYGCPYRGILTSYSAPIGASADGLSLVDTSYDGNIGNRLISGGLGKLTDGATGHDNFEKFPHKWVGWRKTKNGVNFVPLTFEFTERQNLSAILVHSSNQFKQHAPVFSSALVSFSVDGKHFSRREVHYSYSKDTKFETARWVRIPIPDRIAQKVELKLFFDEDATWLLISEIKFETNRIVFELTENESEEMTFHHITETENNGQIGGMVIFLLLIISIPICGCVLLVVKKRDRVKATSPSPTFNARGKDVRIAMHGPAIKHVTHSTYQMACDNVHNALLEKCPILADVSDYAEPDITSDRSCAPMLSSVIEVASPITVSQTSSLRRSPLSSIVKYSDYGEVYCTTLPEIDRSKLEFIDKIGQGEFGEVHLCRLESRRVAVKRLHSTSEEDEMAFQREIRVLGTLKHANVVEVIGVSTIDKPILCIMEYMQNGDLKTYLSKKTSIDTSLCISLCTQLAAGLAYLESCNFVHRDIAARNCLVDDEGNAKIADFGMARSLYSAEYYRVEGRFVLPIRWMAPETLLMGKFSTASDVWAFGVTMWEIFSGCQLRPFNHLTDEQIVENIQRTQLDGQLENILARPIFCPPSLYSQLLLPCWRADPNHRPTFETIHLNLQSLIHSSTLLN